MSFRILDESRGPSRVALTRRQMIAVLAGGAASLALPGGAWAGAAAGGRLRVAAPANPSSLDPATGGAGSDHPFLFPMFDTLVMWDFETLEAKPGLAESWQFSDAKTLVLNLRSGVTFHDGTPFDAEAVKFNLERNKTAPRSNIKADLSTVEAVEVTGPMQVTLRLQQPDSALPLILSDRAGMMCSPTAVKKFGDDHDRNPVGAGPWKFDAWVNNERISVTRYENHWRKDVAQVAGIDFAIIPEVNTGLRSVMGGQNDFVYQLSPQQKQIMDRARNIESVSGPTLYCLQIYLNYGRKPLDDQRVRLAINHAIDREAFLKASMMGIGEVAWMNLPKQHWAYEPSLENCWPHDPDKARQLLAEAGYKDGMDLHLLGYTDQRSVQRQEILIEQFRRAGIRCRFENGSIAEKSAQYFAEGRGDGILSAWTGRPDPSLSYALMYLKDAYFNAGHAEPSPELTEAILASRATEDQEARKKELATVQRIVTEQALVAPLIFQYELAGYTPKVQGFKTNLLGKPKFEGVHLA
ncbi:peptide ABC transporter [Verticiella sediminum]|uniref:Peptide ABC transporter n=1 Tax=Verticiella sediminum TaxID=1247510 RepID=A0A556AG98_9BURK|nr:ABC transporter substrate-binding protein [Verticiella sediminum]TSH91905.1 peptide ABC transporter [Verticiella sediminum]